MSDRTADQNATAPGDPHDISALYAVDALDPAEREAFETHLTECARCRSEVADYAEITDHLAAAVPVAPPPALRAAVLDSIHGTLPSPARAAASPADQLTPGGEHARHGAPRAAGVPTTPGAHPRETARRGSRPSLEVLRRRYRRVLALAVSTALVPGALAGGWGLSVQAQQERQQQVVAQEQDRENQLLAAPDVTTRRMDVAGQTGTVLVSKEQDTAMFVADGLPDPGQDKQYQLWLIKGTTPAPDTHFAGDRSRIWLTGDVREADAVALTVEPAGGSSTPTMPLVASTPL